MITIHGICDYNPTKNRWDELMDSTLVSADVDLCATIHGITRSLREWQKVWNKLGAIDFHNLFLT